MKSSGSNEIGDFGETVVSKYFNRKHKEHEDCTFYSKIDYNQVFKATLRDLNLVGDGSFDYEWYMDLMYAREDNRTDDIEWCFIQVKTTCQKETSQSLFKFMIDAHTWKNYNKLSNLIMIESDNGWDSRLPNKTKYLIAIVRRDGIWIADMREVLRKGVVRGNFLTVEGIFEYADSLTLEESLQLKSLCEVNNGYILKNNSVKELGL